MDHESEPSKPSAFRYTVLIFIVAVVYVASARLGLSLAFVEEAVTLIWPPTGIALAALLLLGYRMWPGIVLGAFVANLWSNGSVLFSVGTAIGNPLEALAGAYLLHRVIAFRTDLDRVKDVAGLVLLAAMLAPTISATIGVFSLSLSGGAAWADFGSIWLGWWMGDALGTLIVAPVLLTVAGRPWRRYTRAQYLEALVLLAGLAALTYVEFVASASFLEASWPLAYAIYPFVIWAALRFGPPGAAAAVLLSSIIAVLGTIRGNGPFAEGSDFDNVLQLLVFMAMLALTALLLGAVIAERNADQADLSTLNLDLERRIHSRTAALKDEIQERTRAEDALRGALARAEALHHLSHSVIHVERLPEVLQAVVDSVAEVLPADRVTLFNFDMAQQQVLHAVKGGPGLSHVAEVEYKELMDGLSGWVLRNNRPALSPKGIPDPRESPAVQKRRAETDCGAIIVALLRYRDLTVGTMTAINSPDEADFTREDVDLMMTMANQATVAIENARLAESVREREERFRMLYNNTPVMLHSVDPEGRLIGVSDYWLDVMGYERDEVLGRRSTEFLTEDAQRYAREISPDYFETGTCTDVAYQMVKKNGAVFDVLLSATAERNEAGEIERSLAVIVDVTDRKKAEQALAEKAEALARSNQELQQFAYVASHDLQEPLRTINSFVKLLEKRYKGQLDEDADTFIGYIVDGSVRMQALIKDILALSRAGSRTLELRPIDVNDVLDRMLEGMQMTLVDAEAEVTHDTLPTVQADATQLSQLLQNLISNAVKFRSEAAPRIHVSAHRSNGAWRFAVQDNGIGIRAGFQDQIFEVFRRLHSRSAYAGTGMGLAICKKIVERHGGRIWVESEEGQGATFFFTVPA